MIVAVPALAVSVPPTVPKLRKPPSSPPGEALLGLLVIVALPAVLAFKNCTPVPRPMTETLVMFALPAELVLLNVMLPGCIRFGIVMIALPAVVESLKLNDPLKNWMSAFGANEPPAASASVPPLMLVVPE